MEAAIGILKRRALRFAIGGYGPTTGAEYIRFVQTSGKKRLQPGRAPIVFLLPGLGAHRLDRSSLALAEMVYARRFSVAVVSSAMNYPGVLETPRGFFHRESAYAEMASYSFEQYLYAFVLPYMRDRLHLITGAEELTARSDLRSVAAGLRGNPKIRHFANANDFVTTHEDIVWITETLGAAHVKLFPSGGHLGNLDRTDVQREIMESRENLAPATP